MVSISVLLILLALIALVLALLGKVPLWLSVLLVILERLIALAVISINV